MKFPKYKPLINLIPGGCIQFMDFGLDLETLRRERRLFREDVPDKTEEPRYPHHLRCLVEQDECLIDARLAADTIGKNPSFRPDSLDDEYAFTLQQALECFSGSWLPVPFLRTTGQPWPDGITRVSRGPTNWARGMFLPAEDEPGIWHLCLAFDTKVEDMPSNADGRYYALSREDLNAASEFLLAWHVRDNSWFVNEQWIDEWLLERYNAGRERAGIREEEYGKQFCLKHIACYMTWLDAARRAINDLRVKVSDSDRSVAMDVDLVLDVGNSRTTGLLVETSSTQKTDLSNRYNLELRDLTNPNRVYSEPFSTRVEFVDVSFGSDMLSRRSGRRTPAFAWPTCVRVGPEATRLATFAVCAEGNTGMSSPKRYLWDENRWTQSWRYNKTGASEPMVARGLFPRQLNEEGTPLDCFKNDKLRRLLSRSILRSQRDTPLFGSFFTRSSLMMFMFAEIITQALVTINSPANRNDRQMPDKARHLRRIILTVPTAMPVASRRIFERWARLAVHLVWKCLGWQDRDASAFQYQTMPEVVCEWDEASCSQLVLLYNEIMVKHVGDASQYFSLYGRPRVIDGQERSTVRIASIDIGGGTTDLSITTHVLVSGSSETARIKPQMNFRDGFNLAGDEVVRDVIQEVIIQAINKEMQRAGADARKADILLFGRYNGKNAMQRTRQGQFVRQIIVPAALGMLEGAEQMDRDDNTVYCCRLADFFEKPAERQRGAIPFGSGEPVFTEENAGKRPFVPIKLSPMPQRHVLEYVQGILKDCSAPPTLDFGNIPITFSLDIINRCISRTLGGTISSLCEMVHAYDADLLLVTGRPSAWKGVMQTILAMTPLAPARIISMRDYNIGSWYPCSNLYGRIVDPKTTVVVGAILCALSNGYLEKINFDPSDMRMTSTARFVGELNLQGQLENAKIWFSANKDGSTDPEEKTITYHSPITVGYRQLAVERWPATAYYKLELKDKNCKGPCTVRLALTREEDTSKRQGDEPPQAEGNIEILEVIGPDGIPLSTRSMSATLQTLPAIEGYWLDSGIVISEG